MILSLLLDVVSEITIKANLDCKVNAARVMECRPVPSPSPSPSVSPSPSPIPTPTPIPTPSPIPTPTPSPGGVVISNVISINVKHNRATINWTTDKKSTSQVEYGETAAFGLKTRAWTVRPVTKHEQILFGLLSDKTYHFRVVSGASISPTFTFKTPLATAWLPPIGSLPPKFDPPSKTGPVTHYVHNKLDCTTIGNGTVTTPRCFIPLIIPRGSIVEVHGETFYDSKGVLITANGTATEPIFIRGVNDGQGFPLLDLPDPFIIQGDYVVIEYFTFERANVVTGYNTFNGTTRGTNIVLRYNEIRDHPAFGSLSLYGQDILARDNFIHHNQAGGPSGSDQHGIFVGPGSSRVMVYDNTLSYNTGDGIQFCHGCTNPPNFVYVGRNDAHDNRENGIDLKACNHVVISQNKIHGHKSVLQGTPFCFNDNSMCYVQKPTNQSDGSGFIVGSDGQSLNVWAFGNEIYGNQRGVRIEDGNGPGGVHFVANVFHDNSFIGFAVQSPGGSPIVLVGNTFSKNTTCIKWETGAGNTTHLVNNICDTFGDVAISIGNSLPAQSTMNTGLFFKNGAGSVYIWWGADYRFKTTTEFDTFPAGSGNLIADPIFVNRATNDFHLTPNSPAVDKGIMTNVYDAFEAMFNQSIRMDYDGKSFNGLPDIGAFEK